MRQPRIGVPLSLALHMLVAVGVSRLAWQTAPPSAKPAPRVVWLTASTPARTLRPENPGADRARQSDLSDEVTVERESEPPAQLADQALQLGPSETASTREPEPLRRPLLDLADARRRVIEEILEERERGSSYLSFAFPGTIGEERAFNESERHRRAEAGLQAPLTAFDSPSKGRAGFAERTVLGQYVKWVSDECYQTYGSGNLFVLPIVEGLFAVPMTTCVGTTPRGDLFQDAKPSYLMDADERIAATERWQRIERLRRPTTGTAMPLEK